MGEVEALLDRSIAAEGYVIPEDTGPLVDLGQIDFDKLRAAFATARKRTEIEKLRALLQRKLTTLVQLNRSRVDYLEKFEKMIAEYNAGSHNIEAFFEQLLRLAQELTEEERRSVVEKLTEEELAVFDLLTQPDPTLTKDQDAEVKKIVRSLLEKLKREKLVLDWRKRQQARQAVRLCIEEELDKLPEVYTPELYQEKCDATYRHVYDAYYGEGRSLYSSIAA
jgi:type I restriction enzyme R subunit